MKTIVTFNSKIGYIDGYVYDTIHICDCAIVVMPNMEYIQSIPIDQIKVLGLEDQKKYNKLFFN